MRPIVTALLLSGPLLVAVAARAQPPVAWRAEVGSAIDALAVSPGGTCLAIGTRDSIQVRDQNGETLWERPMPGSRWLARPNAIALSPDCELLVVAGDPGYRFVWLLRRDGRSRHVRTNGTPTALSVSRDGQRVVIGTGAGHVSLVDATGGVLWETALPLTCCIQGLEFAADDRHIVMTHGATGLLTASGTLVWQVQGGRMDFAADLQRFAVSWEPPHFSSLGFAASYDRQGDETWTLDTFSPSVAISDSGNTTLAFGMPLPDGYRQVWVEEEHPLIRFVDRGGRVTRSEPVRSGRAVCYSRAGGCFLVAIYGEGLRCYGENGDLAWQLPGGVSERLFGDPCALLVTQLSRGIVEVRRLDVPRSATSPDTRLESSIKEPGQSSQ